MHRVKKFPANGQQPFVVQHSSVDLHPAHPIICLELHVTVLNSVSIIWCLSWLLFD